MQHFVNQYVYNCYICICIKTLKHTKYEVLWLLSVSQHCWKNMIMNFIIDLFLMNDYDFVCVSVN